MPKSKRNKVVTLSKVEKKGKERKVTLIDAVREAVDLYPHLYVFRYKNMRNNAFKTLKDALKDTTKVFLGSNKVMQVALGREQEGEYRENLHQISERLSGFSGIMLTNLSREEIEKEITAHEELDYARAGQNATETIIMEPGPVKAANGDPIAHTIEPKLRQHGMNTRLEHGTVELLAQHKVCTEGGPLSAKAAALLRIFDIKMARFQVILDSYYHEGNVEIISEPDEEDLQGDGAMHEVEFM